MQPKVDLVTLGVPDLAAARRFYVDGLGWEPVFEVPGEVVFVQVGFGLLLSLFGAADLEADIGISPAGERQAGPPRISLAQILRTEQEVIDTTERAAAAGGLVLKRPQKATFGGFHAYFADPAGFRWEIATNPGWSVDGDGRVSLGPIA